MGRSREEQPTNWDSRFGVDGWQVGTIFARAGHEVVFSYSRVADLKAQIDANRDLSTSLAFDREPAGRAMQRAIRVRALHQDGGNKGPLYGQ